MRREIAPALRLLAVVWLCACTTSAARNGLDGGPDAPARCLDVDGAIPGTPVATFDHDVEGFVLDPAPGGTLTNLAAPDAGAMPPPALSWDPADGNPSPGALALAAPFSGPNQFLLAYQAFGCGAIHDWTDRTLHARIKVASGDFSQVALVYVATSADCKTYDFAYGAYARLDRTSCWQELTLDLVSPGTRTAGFDPSSVTDVGIQLYSGTSDAGVGPATFLIDSFSVE